MSPTKAELAAWRDHIGRRETRGQRLDVETARRYAAAVGSDLDVERAFPPLGHWAFFLDAASPDALGADGHPRRGGGFLPPVSLARRMFAGAVIRLDAPLRLDAPAEQIATIADVRHRSGRSGDLVFVEVDKVISQDGHARVRERQTIVYRPPGDPLAPISPVASSPDQTARTWTPRGVDLFRFSAATFNSHRIHYDRPYATSTEGYPGLVVHGPFTAVKLFAFAAQRAAPGSIRGFEVQARAPLFDGQPVLLRGEADEVAAVRCDGAVAMTGRIGG